jgi:hypothetical protein
MLIVTYGVHFNGTAHSRGADVHLPPSIVLPLRDLEDHWNLDTLYLLTRGDDVLNPYLLLTSNLEAIFLIEVLPCS